MILFLQRRDDATAIRARSVLRELELRLETLDPQSERDDRPDQRVALLLGHREAPRRRTSSFEPLNQRVEHAARFDRGIENLERAMRVHRGEVPRRYRLRGFSIPRRRDE